MQTAVIGYPRIGTLRELKFASEQYFRKEIEAGELLQTAKELRKTHWLTQKEAGISFISSNDFSFYDNMLDTAVLFGIVPKRYKELQLSELDIYFAMARGYQGDSGDVKALAMKKWFNTNYHYIVPEVEDEMVIIGSNGRVTIPNDWWNTGYFEANISGREFLKRYSFNFDGNGFRYLLQELMIMIRDKRTECTRLFYDESVKLLEVLETINQKG